MLAHGRHVQYFCRSPSNPVSSPVPRVSEVDAAHLVAAAATRRASCLATLVVGKEVWWLLLVLVALQ